MDELFTRSLPIFGQAGVQKLKNSTVMIVGIGGVGGAAAEAVARAGVGHMILIDGDSFDATNLNRQAASSVSVIGQNKATVMKARIGDINPYAVIDAFPIFYGADTEGEIHLDKCDYIIDAIDDVKAKVLLAQRCKEKGIPLISAMGTGNRIDPTKLMIGDIFSTSGCPLARSMRRELKKVGIESLTVVWSKEEPIKVRSEENGFSVGSVPFVPPVAGMIMAGQVICSLSGINR